MPGRENKCNGIVRKCEKPKVARADSLRSRLEWLKELWVPGQGADLILKQS